jgi:hypothetical protein
MDFFNLNDTEDKENYNPVVNTFSPVKLVNQKRYKTLKNIVMKASSDGRLKIIPLQEKNGNVKINNNVNINNTNEEGIKELEFKDETIKKYGL